MIEVEDVSNAEITITDMLGNVVYTQAITGKRQLIGAQQLAAGLYVVTVKTTEGVEVFRVVKE